MKMGMGVVIRWGLLPFHQRQQHQLGSVLGPISCSKVVQQKQQQQQQQLVVMLPKAAVMMPD
jgi:hypothetical protein